MTTRCKPREQSLPSLGDRFRRPSLAAVCGQMGASINDELDATVVIPAVLWSSPLGVDFAKHWTSQGASQVPAPINHLE